MIGKSSNYEQLVRGGRMTKWKGRVASYAPSVGLALAVVAGADNIAFADVITGDVTSRYDLVLDEALDITNSGSILVIDGPYGGTALQGDDGFEGSVTNEGTIGNWASGGYISAVEIGGDLYGTITNNDDIVADVDGIDDDLGAVGIYLNNDVETDAVIANNGDISATASVTDGNYSSNLYAEAIGVDVYDIYGAVTNAGDVTAEATVVSNSYGTSDGDVYAAGFEFETLYGSFENTGDIEATANQTSADYYDPYVEAYGINGGDIEGSFVSTGDVSATSNLTDVDDDAYGAAYAISLGDVDGSVELDGTIRASVSAEDSYQADLEAFGVDVSDINGSVTSTADVTVTLSHDDYGYSEGIGFNAYWVGGLLETSGDVNVTVDVYDGADATGISVYYGVGSEGTVSNLGDITVEAISEIDEAYAAGIYIGDTISGTVSNEGALDVTATGEDAWGYGIYAYDIQDNGTVSNLGDITVNVGQYDDDNGYTQIGAGIWVNDGLDQGTVDNSGSITTTVTASSDDATLFASGIHIDGDMGGYNETQPTVEVTIDDAIAMVVNSGDITVDATQQGLYDDYNYGDVLAAGISVGYGDSMNSVVVGTLGSTATIDNQGTIRVTGDGKDDDGDVMIAGIGIMGDLGQTSQILELLPINFGTGNVLNSGLIDVSATSVDYAAASGIHIDGSAVNGVISNSGTLEVDTSGSSSDATGIYIGNQLAMMADSEGLIEVSARADRAGGDASAHGLFVENDVAYDGSFTNIGEVQVDAFSEDGGAYAAGMGVEDEMDGQLVNEGYIEVGAIAIGSGDWAEAVGAYGRDIGYSGLMENAGDMVVTAAADYAEATGLGSEYVYGTQTNSGNLEVTATANNGTGSATGLRSVYVYSDYTLSNTGYLEVNATSEDDAATAIGIGADTVYGTSSNSGEMVIWSDGTGPDSSTGIRVGEVDYGGTVENTGIIRVDSADGSSYGIDIGDLDGQLIQSGMIDAPVDQYAILVRDGYGDAYLDAQGFIVGKLTFHNDEVVLRSGPNQSVNWTVDGTADVVLDETSGVPWFKNGDEYATFDTSGLVGLNNAAMGIARLGFSANLLADRPAEGVTVSSKGGWNNNNGGAWVYGQTNQIDFDGGEVSLDQAVSTQGLAVGYTGLMQNGLTFTLLAGGASGTVATDSLYSASYDADFNGAFGGAVLSKQLGATNIAFGLMGGALTNHTERTVNDNTLEGGVDQLSADFNSQFITPELALSHTIGNAAGGVSVTPGVRVRYASISVDGYTETGSNASNEAMVDSYTVGMTEVEASVAMAHDFSFGTLTGSVGLLSRNASDASTTVEMIGDINDVPMLYNDAMLGTVGLSLAIPVSAAGSFQVGAEAIFGGASSDIGYSANVGFALRF
jgi:hypothetical protein